MEAYEPRRPGRPTVLEALGLTVADLVAAYEREGTLRKTAAATGVCKNTLKKYLKGTDVMHGRGARPQPYAWRAARTTPVTTWFKEHRNDRLPRSVRDLAELSGFSEGQVRKFLFNRQQAAYEYLRALGDLREQPKAIIDVAGRRIPLGMIQDYNLKVDRYDLTVQISGVLRLGLELRAVVGFSQYQGLFKAPATDGRR